MNTNVYYERVYPDNLDWRRIVEIEYKMVELKSIESILELGYNEEELIVLAYTDEEGIKASGSNYGRAAKIYESFPNNKIAMTNLSWMYHIGTHPDGKNLEKAKELLEKAKKLLEGAKRKKQKTIGHMSVYL